MTWLFSVLLLAACSANRDNLTSARAPGLDVADVALASGAPDTALHIAQQALAANPRNVQAMVRAAEAQAALGHRDQAAHGFSQALAIAPDDTGAALGLGRLKLAEDPAATVSLLLRVTTHDPHNVAALVDLGIARDLLGQHTEAQSAYRLALALDPESTAGQVNLGLSLALSGDPRQAIGILRPLARGSAAAPRVRQDLAVALALAGDDDEAASVLRVDIPQPQVLAAVESYHLLRSGP